MCIRDSSGGIPAIREDDTKEQAIIKHKRLVQYHINLNAEVKNSKFIYHLDKVLEIIPIIFAV